MASLSVVERYSYALYQIAVEKGMAEQVRIDLEQLAKTFSHSPFLEDFFNSKNYGDKEKQALLKDLLDRLQATTLTRNYYNLLMENRRFSFDVPNLSSVTYSNYYKESLGIKHGLMKLPKLPDLATQTLLSARLEERLNLKLELEFIEDDTMLDGSYLEIEGVVYEDSLKNRLVNLDKWMKGI